MKDSKVHRELYVPDLLVNALSGDPNRALLHLSDGPTLTVGEVRDATSQFMQVLTAHGVDKGVKVGLLSLNRPEVLHIAHASQLLASVYVPMHPLSGASDHVHVVKDSEIEVLIFEADRYEQRVLEIAAAVPGLRLLALGASTVAADIGHLAQSYKPQPLVAPEVAASDVMRLGYTGGTTGKPKAIASVQRVGLASLRMILTEWDWPEIPHMLSCTPLSHAGSAMILPTLIKGGTLTVLPRFSPVTVMETIQQQRINCIMLVPSMIYALLDHPRFDEFDLSSLETIFYGASAMSPIRLREAIERIGPVFCQFYGQAEAPMTIATLRKRDHDVNDLRRLSSCGRPSPWIDVALLDADGSPVPDGENGEICVRGALVMDGYRNNPELTAEVMRGGWLHTGDVAVRDPGGFLRIVDRTKDMIVTGGFNVYPRAIDDIIAEHAAVAQVAVVGIPDPRWGEAVTAFIVLKPGASATEAELIAPVAARKGSYQAPKTVRFIDAIPETPVGKPDKKALRTRASTERSD